MNIGQHVARALASSPRARPTVGLLVDRRYLTHAQPAGLAAALRAAGAEVRTLVTEDATVDLCADSWCAGFDVIVARGRSGRLIAMLRAAEAYDIPVMNSPSAIESVHDKAGMAAVMAAAGVPTPKSWLGCPHQIACRTDLRFPLILKPTNGDNARGLRIVQSVADLAALDWPDPVAMAQELHRGDGHDLKLYVAGAAVWAVRRVSPVADDGSARPVANPGRRVATTPGLRTLARKCAQLFGLSLCGIDCVMTPAGPVVIEVNDFPNYRGIGGHVDDELARVVLARASAGAGMRSGTVPA
jgi:glutathione synthase/RimK-type ligase-like ATP-grasp enzyme